MYSEHVGARDLKSVLRLEQFRILQTQIPMLYVMLIINAAILAFSVYGSVSEKLSIGVPGAFGALIVVRSVVWFRRKNSVRDDVPISRILFRTTVLAGVISFGFGMWGVALLHAQMASLSAVPMFIAFGSVACAYCLTALPEAAFLTIILAAAPIVLTLLLSGVRSESSIGLNLLLIFLLILRLVSTQHKKLVESVSSNHRANTLAYIDPLTGLSNRRSLINNLESAFESYQNAQTIDHLAVAIVDLDGFKAVNDTHGHLAGDAILQQAGERIQHALGECAIVSRMGGDEFAAVITGLNASQVIERGKRIALELSQPYQGIASRLSLSASVGLAINYATNDQPTNLMSQADVALYEAKHNGGNAALLFDPPMADRLQRRTAIEQALRQSDPAPDVEVVYQPIFDAKSRQIKGFEALARWRHPQLGCVSPLEFIGVAEQAGLIATLSNQIFDKAIYEASKWPTLITLSINLSALEVTSPGTPSTILQLCAKYGFDPRRLEVEVTETSVLSDFSAARQQLGILRAHGIKISLDDFGAGHASIAYLKEVAFDRVKIDGELVADIIDSARARRLLNGILQLCSAIGLPTTAEKVECEKQLAVLVGLGCDCLQGYLLGCPMEARAALALVAERREAA